MIDHMIVYGLQLLKRNRKKRSGEKGREAIGDRCWQEDWVEKSQVSSCLANFWLGCLR